MPFHGYLEDEESNIEPIIKYFPKWNIKDADKLWCAAFVYYCCIEAGFQIPYSPNECITCSLAGCGGWEEYAIGDKRIEYHRKDDKFVPEAGDIVIYDKVFIDQEHDHIGIIVEVNADTITVAEGNTFNDNVSRVIERKIDEHIRAYIRIPDGYKYYGILEEYKMYIEKYWDNYIGGTDDSLTLLEYLAGKEKEEISLGEIFADTGLDKLNGEFQEAEGLSVPVDGFEAEIYYAIDLLTDLAALMLECKMSGSVNLSKLLEEESEDDCNVCITATPEEHALMNKALMDFVAAPLTYNLSEMMEEEEIQEMATVCEEVRKELYEEAEFN